MAELMPKEDFYQALEGARQPEHSGGHPFSQLWAEGKLSREQLGRWAVQHYYYIAPIPQQFAALYARLPDLDARQHLLENLLGEEMPENPEKRHPDLMIKFAEACGLTREDCVDAELKDAIFPTTRAMRSWIWELSSIRHIAEASAGIMVALEGQLPTLYPAYVQAMRKMGFSEDDLEFFHVHIEGDEEHADIGLQLCHRYATTPELQAAAIAAVKASTSLRWSMLDGIYANLVHPQAA